MRRNDYIGIGISVALHALLLLIFAFAPPPPEPELEQIGTIEVEFGPVATGRPVQQAPEPEPEPQRPAPAPPERTPPVRTPQVRPTPSPEAIRPTPPPQPTRPTPTPPAPSTNTERSGGSPDGSTGESSGRQGEGNTAERSSPFSIEGLNRSLRAQPLPRNVAGTLATLTVEISVSPTGQTRIRRWIRRGNPDLEREVERAISNWRFNPLPDNAPQVDQQGRVTFRFTVN